MSSFMKIRPVAQLFHADRETDRRTVTRKLIVAFRNFEKAPKNVFWYSCKLHVILVRF